MAETFKLSLEKVVYPPTYVSIPESACRLIGPFRCPDCAGVVMLDEGQAETADVLFCPYCLSGLRIPGAPVAFEPKTRVRKIATRNGITITA